MNASAFGPLSEVGRIVEIVLKHPHEAFSSQGRLDDTWQALNYTGRPDFARALDEYAEFVDLLGPTGLILHCLPETGRVGPDSVYVRDASVVCARGVILCSMGKAAREGEPAAQGEAYREWGMPVVGAIQPPGRLEGGDVVWLDDRTVIVGRGYRTNDEGIRQFRDLLGDSIDALVTVQLPHWRGPGDVFHLMSVLSPVDVDLAVVYSPLMPVPLRELLVDRGIALVEVPDGEFESMAANVLAVAPRRCVMLDGNPMTRARLEAAEADVRVYAGREISLKGGGGPTCLTRPIRRT
jgi:N-dimethylarginine dimethylaminohydrolase